MGTLSRHLIHIAAVLGIFAGSVAEAQDPVPTAKDIAIQFAKTQTICAGSGYLAGAKILLQSIPVVSDLTHYGNGYDPNYRENLSTGSKIKKNVGEVCGGVAGFVIENVADGLSICWDSVCYAADWVGGKDPSKGKYFQIDDYGITLDPYRSSWTLIVSGPDTACSQESKKMESMYAAYKKSLAAAAACKKYQNTNAEAVNSNTKDKPVKDAPVIGYPIQPGHLLETAPAK